MILRKIILCVFLNYPIIVTITEFRFGTICRNNVISSTPDDFIALLFHCTQEIRFPFILHIVNGSVSCSMWI